MAIDVENVLHGLGIDYLQSKNRFMIQCPFHNDSDPSCGVWGDTGYFRCFACGEEGSLAELIAKVEDIPIHQALRRLRGQSSLKELEDSIGKMLDSKDVPLAYYDVESFMKVYPAVLPETKVWDYLIGRGITSESISRFQMRWGGDTGKYHHRVVLPIFTVPGKLLAYVGRAIYSEMAPKTRKSRSPHRALFGLHELLKCASCFEAIVIVEGEFDAIYLQQYGIPAVANMGTSPLGAEKIRLLRKYAKKVVLAYDGDDAGIHAMFGKDGKPGEVYRLSRHIPTISVRLPDGLDPNELCEQDVLSLFGKWREPCLISA